MAPPRLPSVFVERLIAVLEATPAASRQGAAGRQEVVTQIHADLHRITGSQPRETPHEFATHLLGTAANLVPAYEGPRQGWTALGEILALLLADPAVPAADRAWIAALAVRYRLIPWAPPAAGVPPAVQAQLAAVPPQPPPFYEGGMFPPTVQRGWHYERLQAARAAGDWEQVLAQAEALQGDLAVPELAAEVGAELAARALDLPALIAAARAALASRPQA